MNWQPKDDEVSTIFDTQIGERPTLSFSVEGLTTRDELLFKGYVRLLDRVTEHHWQYHEVSTTKRVDLLVTDEHALPTRFLQTGGIPQATLLLGTGNARSSGSYLAWPLQPYELENQLNRLGREITSADANTPSKAAAVIDIETNRTGSSTADSVVSFRLRHWPKPMLLTEPGRMRLATLLTAKAMGLDELVFRSALPKAVCEHFLADMHTAGLVIYPESANNQGTVPVLPAPKKMWLPAQLERQAVLPNIQPLQQPGLLQRIRVRLGIKGQRSS